MDMIVDPCHNLDADLANHCQRWRLPNQFSVPWFLRFFNVIRKQPAYKIQKYNFHAYYAE